MVSTVSVLSVFFAAGIIIGHLLTLCLWEISITVHDVRQRGTCNGWVWYVRVTLGFVFYLLVFWTFSIGTAHSGKILLSVHRDFCLIRLLLLKGQYHHRTGTLFCKLCESDIKMKNVLLCAQLNALLVPIGYICCIS